MKQEAFNQYKREAKEIFWQENQKVDNSLAIVIYLLTLVSFLMTVFWSYWALIAFVPLILLTMGATKVAIEKYNRQLARLIKNAPDDTFLDGTYSKRHILTDQAWRNKISFTENEVFNNLKQEFTITSGVKEGISTFSFDNGCRYFTVSYKSGVLDGPQTWYDPKGNVVRSESYVNGELSETAVEYYPGEKKRMIQEGGSFQFFDDKGILRVKITTDPTRDYSPVGEWHEFDLKGEICKTYSFITREENGRNIKVCTELNSPIDSDAEVVEWVSWIVDKYQFSPSKFFHRHFQTEGREETMRITVNRRRVRPISSRPLPAEVRTASPGWSGGSQYASWSTRPVVNLSDLIQLG